MTVSGTLLTYSVDTTTETSWPIEAGYRAEISSVVSTVAKKDVLIFDVVRFLLNLGITVDQLRDRDDELRGMEWNGDEDMPGIINAVRDELQLAIESKAAENDTLIENMAIDSSKVATVGRLKCLAEIWHGKGNTAKGDRFEKLYEQSLSAMLGAIKWDTAQDGNEDSGGHVIQVVRFVS